jgi:hypothetical protein
MDTNNNASIGVSGSIEVIIPPIKVMAPRYVVRHFASDPALLAEWNNEYIGCTLDSAEDHAEAVRFSCITRRGDKAQWKLTLKERDGSEITEVDAKITIWEKTGSRSFLRRQVLTKRRRKTMLMQSLARMKGFAESAARHDASELEPGDMVALLNAYTSQFGSFTSLLWQVPALGLTAQAFLMTIVLGTGYSHASRYAACALSIIISYASYHLMHDQRARAINHAEMAKRISYKLSLTNLLGGSFGLDDAVPAKGTDAQNMWTTNRVIYGIWVVCMALFAIIGAIVIISLLSGTSWFIVPSP